MQCSAGWADTDRFGDKTVPVIPSSSSSSHPADASLSSSSITVFTLDQIPISDILQAADQLYTAKYLYFPTGPTV